MEKLSDHERDLILKILSEIHKHGIVHNDIRPENILQHHCDGVQVMFIDFALFKRVSNKGNVKNYHGVDAGTLKC